MACHRHLSSYDDGPRDILRLWRGRRSLSLADGEIFSLISEINSPEQKVFHG